LRPDFAPAAAYSVLQAFQPFLKSIDMRTIAVKPQASGEWENLVTSIFVSERSVEEVEKEHSRLPELSNDQIKLVLCAFPFEYSLFDGFVQGDIRQRLLKLPTGEYVAYGSSHIKTRQFNPLELKMVPSRIRLAEVLKWVLTATGSNSSPDREQLWAIVQNQAGEAKRLYYARMEDLIKEVLKMDNIFHNIDFILTIADLAKIKNVIFGVSSLEVEIERIVGLKDLQLNVVVERTTDGGFRKNVFRQGFDADKSEEKSIGKICLSKVTVQTPPLCPYDSVELELIHRNSALTLDQAYERVPLQNVVEPFFKTLDAFCPFEKFKKMLLKPEDFKNAPEKMFENAVAWLLSLAGFHTIYLGANSKATKTSFDVLQKNGRYHIGSADIIAYEDNERVLLVDCDISGLDEKKIQKLIEIREHFKASCDYGELKFVPALFTPRYFGEDMKNKPVAIVDGNVIERILEDLSKGDIESARSKIQQLPFA
jgi:hypothetical protein